MPVHTPTTSGIAVVTNAGEDGGDFGPVSCGLGDVHPAHSTIPVTKIANTNLFMVKNCLSKNMRMYLDVGSIPKQLYTQRQRVCAEVDRYWER
jgi:hypothetical protein